MDGADGWAGTVADAAIARGSRAWRAACALPGGQARRSELNPATAAAGATAAPHPAAAADFGPTQQSSTPAAQAFAGGSAASLSRRAQLLQALAPQLGGASPGTAMVGNGGADTGSSRSSSSNSSAGGAGSTPASCAALIAALGQSGDRHSAHAAGSRPGRAELTRAAGQPKTHGMPAAPAPTSPGTGLPASRWAGVSGGGGGVLSSGANNRGGGATTSGSASGRSGRGGAAGGDIQRDLAARMEAIRAQLSSICSNTLTSVLMDGPPEAPAGAASAAARAAQPQVEGSWGSSVSGDGREA